MGPTRRDTAAQRHRRCRRSRVRGWVILKARGQRWGVRITEPRFFAIPRSIRMHARCTNLSSDGALEVSRMCA